MRSPIYNVPPEVAHTFPVDQSLAMFGRMTLVRYFEAGIIQAVQEKRMTGFVYLSSGQEAVAAALAPTIRNWQIFPQHRAHDVYLSIDAPPIRLRDELLQRPTGTSGRRAGSNCLQYHEDGIRLFGHHGLIGENVPQGVGAALANGEKTVCFFGDGAAEEDYVLVSMGFAATHRLPVLFVCMDNDLSILTETRVRRSWHLTDIAQGFGLPAINVSDDPWAIAYHAKQLIPKLPALLNCFVCRAYWHAGVGVDGPPAWDRYTTVKDTLIALGHADAVQEIDKTNKTTVEQLWDRELLLKPLGI